MPLTKEAILTADDLTRERVEVPEWGGDVWIAVLPGTEREKFEKRMAETPGEQLGITGVLAHLLVAVLQNEAGELLFTEADIPRLAGKSSVVLMDLIKRAMTLNALMPADVEELAKNSPSAPGAASASASPENSAAPSASC